jgi:hypothetical protein
VTVARAEEASNRLQARGSETCSRVCRHLPSRERKGAVVRQRPSGQHRIAAVDEADSAPRSGNLDDYEDVLAQIDIQARDEAGVATGQIVANPDIGILLPAPNQVPYKRCVTRPELAWSHPDVLELCSNTALK